MGRAYVMNRTASHIKEVVRKNALNIEVVHRPVDKDGKESLWPYGLKDKDENFAWFEEFEGGCHLMLWGTNDPTYILQFLRSFKVRVLDTF
jgi:hypothetical protein